MAGGIDTKITDGNGTGIAAFVKRKSSGNGLLVFTEPFVAEGDDVLLPFIDFTTGSADMNVDSGFSGTPEMVHDGTDTTAWVASNLSGTSFVFNATTHARQGLITVKTFGNLAGAVINVAGTAITTTTLTEGVNWTAATSNDATATSIESAIEAVTGISSTVSGAVVTVNADLAAGLTTDITTLTTDAVGGDMTVTAQSIDGILATNTNSALFEDGTSTNMSNFSAISGSIFITAWTQPQAGKDLELQARLNGVDVGSSVMLSDFVDVSILNQWQDFAINKSDFDLNGDTIDEFTLTTIDTAPGQPPDFFLDLLQIEASGAPTIFSLAIPDGFTYNMKKIVFSMRDDSGVTIVNGVPVINPTQFVFQSRLAVGVISRATIDKQTIEINVVRCNQDFTVASGVFKNKMTDNSSSGAFTIEFDFGSGVKFVQSRGDGTDIVTNDDLTGLAFFKVIATGDLRLEVSGDQ